MLHVYVTVPEKTDHTAQTSNVEILILRCSALFTLRNSAVRIVHRSRVMRVQVRAPDKLFLAEMGLICEKASSAMFSIYNVCLLSDVTRANHKI